MEKAIQPIHEILSLHDGTFKCSLADIKSEDEHTRLNGKGNTINYIAGHTVNGRFFMAGLLGIQEENPFGDLFRDAFDPAKTYPSLPQILSTYDDISSKLIAKLEELSADEYESALPQPFPVREQTVLSGLAFLAEHEGYHIGQLCYLRVQFGYMSTYDVMFAGA